MGAEDYQDDIQSREQIPVWHGEGVGVVKIYISGGITGVKNYKRKFNKAERLLKKKGYEVINPVTIGDALNMPSGISAEKAYSRYMLADIKALLGCNAIYLLKGWSDSRGAKIEAMVAEACGMRLIAEGEA